SPLLEHRASPRRCQSRLPAAWGKFPLQMTQTRPAAVPGRLHEDAPAPDLSVVVTVFDEERSVDELYRRTVAALDALGRPYEVVFVDDGSRDGTFARLEPLHERAGRVPAERLRADAAGYRTSEVHEGARALGRRERRRGGRRARAAGGKLAVLAASFDPPRTPRARGVLAAADPVDRDRSRRDLHRARA